MANEISGKSGLLWSAANNWTNNILSLVLFGFLARLVAPQEFGVLALAAIFIALGQIIVNDTVSQALVQRHPLDDEHVNTAFLMMAMIGACLWAIGIMIAPIFSEYFAEPRVKLVLQVLSARLLFDALQAVPLGLLSRQLNFKVLVIRAFFANLVGGALGVILAFAGFGVWALVAQQLSNSLLTFAICLFGVAWRPRFAFSFQHARDLIPFSSFTMLTRCCFFAAGNIDRVLIGRVMDPLALAYYSFSWRVLEMVSSSLTGVAASVSFPLFARRHRDGAALEANFFTVANFTYVTTFPAFVGLATVAPDLVPLVFGKHWVPAVPLIQIMALQGAVSTTSLIHGSVVRALGRADWWLGVTVFGSVLNIAAYLFTIRYGLAAMAASSVAVAIIVAPIHWWMVWRLVSFQMPYYMLTLAKPAAAAAGMAIVVCIVRRWHPISELPLFPRLAVEVVIGMVAYGSLAIAILGRQAVRMIKQVFVA